MRPARLLSAYAGWAVARLGYWVRPYDMLADSRRWRWQARFPCQWSDGLGTVLQRWRDEEQR